MVTSQFTEDRPRFLSVLIHLVFNHMPRDAERHREVKLLKVINSRRLGSSAQQQCSSLLGAVLPLLLTVSDPASCSPAQARAPGSQNPSLTPCLSQLRLCPCSVSSGGNWLVIQLLGV